VGVASNLLFSDEMCDEIRWSRSATCHLEALLNGRPYPLLFSLFVIGWTHWPVGPYFGKRSRSKRETESSVLFVGLDYLNKMWCGSSVRCEKKVHDCRQMDLGCRFGERETRRKMVCNLKMSAKNNLERNTKSDTVGYCFQGPVWI
jgi:hypothetical protein